MDDALILQQPDPKSATMHLCLPKKKFSTQAVRDYTFDDIREDAENEDMTPTPRNKFETCASNIKVGDQSHLDLPDAMESSMDRQSDLSHKLTQLNTTRRKFIKTPKLKGCMSPTLPTRNKMVITSEKFRDLVFSSLHQKKAKQASKKNDVPKESAQTSSSER